MVSQIEQCVQVVTEALATINELEIEISARQEAIKTTKENFENELVRQSSLLDGVELNELAYQLYWHTTVSASTIATMLQAKSSNAVVKILGGFPSGDFCLWCGKEFMYKSRSDRSETIRNGRKNLGLLCDDCRKLYWAKGEGERREREDLAAKQVATYKSMPYQEYLKTEHWQDIRKSALKRSRYRCQLCNSGGMLDVHHRTYERRGEELSSDVIVLCRACHSKFHGKS